MAQTVPSPPSESSPWPWPRCSTMPPHGQKIGPGRGDHDELHGGDPDTSSSPGGRHRVFCDGRWRSACHRGFPTRSPLTHVWSAGVDSAAHCGIDRRLRLWCRASMFLCRRWCAAPGPKPCGYLGASSSGSGCRASRWAPQRSRQVGSEHGDAQSVKSLLRTGNTSAHRGVLWVCELRSLAASRLHWREEPPPAQVGGGWRRYCSCPCRRSGADRGNCRLSRASERIQEQRTVEWFTSLCSCSSSSSSPSRT